MVSESNIEIVWRVLERRFGAGDLSVIAEYVSADFVEQQDGAQGRGPEAVKRLVEHWGVADRLAMLQQLGLVPRPEGRTSESRAA